MIIEEKEKILQAGRIGKLALEFGKTLVSPGAKLLDIAESIEKFIRDSGAKPSFPVNISLNNEAAHYTPVTGDTKKLSTGDIVKLDVGAQIDGYLSDNAATIEVGESGQHSDLIDSTREALERAIRTVRPFISVRDIGRVIESTISAHGFKPVKNLGGHGIGRYDLHSSLFIPNYDDGNSLKIRPGSLIAIEPFASTGIGLIHNGQGGNIYILSGTKVRLGEMVYREFNTVPFAQRWLCKLVPDCDQYLKQLMRVKEVSQFPVLREHKGVLISQAEHTLLVTNDDVIVTTA